MVRVSQVLLNLLWIINDDYSEPDKWPLEELSSRAEKAVLT